MSASCGRHRHGRHGVTSGLAGAEALAGIASVVFVVFVIARALTAEDVEFVDEVEHDVRVDGVAPRVAALLRGDGAADVALLVQDVVELQAHSCCVAFEEGLRNLPVPKELVGVHRVVRVAAARTHAQVGRNAHAPVEVEVGLCAVGELPRVHIIVFLQRGTRVLVSQRSQKPDVEPGVTVSNIEVLAYSERARGIL